MWPANTQVKAALASGQPAISVDTKKKELVGDFRNAGHELRPKGQPETVQVHGFKIPELGSRGAVWHLRHRGQHGLGQCRR
jgi:hypothetical protein